MSGLSDELLRAEFSHASGVTYLDHAGATLYSSKQLEAHLKDLTSHLYANPHSSSVSSHLTTVAIDNTREVVLGHFHTDSDHYDVVFTSGCTAALNLLSHAFPWGRGGTSHAHSCKPETESDESDSSLFCYLDDNHTSVVGMREVARQYGAITKCISMESIIEPHQSLNEPYPTLIEPHPPLNNPHQPHPGPFCLFAYPAQSNFSGCKYPLSWCEDIPSGRVMLEGGEEREGKGRGRGKPLSGDWMVVLDAASCVSTSPLDLSIHHPHFVSISFYKMFGFPTGLGALLVRKDCQGLLAKSYYGGGTVKATDPWSSWRVPRDLLHERLEDGTIPFLDILSLRHGFSALIRLGKSMADIREHTFKLARTAYTSLSSLRHANGRRVCLLYCNTDYEDPSKQGPIVNFNLQGSDGQVVGYNQVEKLASVYNIHLRTGCFCNTGACMRMLGIDSGKLRHHLEQGHECGDSVDLIDATPTGSVRISFGYMSTCEDLEQFLRFIRDNFVKSEQAVKLLKDRDQTTSDSFAVSGTLSTSLQEAGIPRCPTPSPPRLLPSPPYPSVMMRCGDLIQVTPTEEHPSPTHLHSIILYPIKSCAGFRVQQWPVGEKGLLYDREWMVVSEETGALLSQKQEPLLCLIHPSIDLTTSTLTLNASGYSPLSLPLQDTPLLPSATTSHTLSFLTRVCRDRVRCIDYGDEVGKWLTQVLKVEARLVRHNPDHKRNSLAPSKEEGAPSNTERASLLSLANEAQYLLLSQSSVEHILREIQSTCDGWETTRPSHLVARFRPNLVVSGAEVEPYCEEEWREVRIGELIFQCVGKCSRCQMVCIDPETGGRGPEPLRTLMMATKKNKGTHFGVYLCHFPQNIIK